MRRWSAACGLVLFSSVSAWALPPVGTVAPRGRVVDIRGNILDLRRLTDRPVLLVFESRESGDQNTGFKERLGRLARRGNYRKTVHMIPIASVESYDFWPARGFVEAAVASDSERFGVTIWCDWTGAFRRAWGLRPEVSSVILIGRDQRVRFSHAGPLSRALQNRVIDLLRQELTEDAPASNPVQR